MAPQKRVNKSKPEILGEMAQRAKVEKFKDMGRRVFPLLKTETIYDAQTVLDAVSGYIKFELAVKEQSLKLNDLLVDFSKEPKGEILDAMDAIKVELQQESAKDVADFLELMGRTFSSYASSEFLKKPMTDLKVEDIISK